MSRKPAENRFQKLVDDISRLFTGARAAQVKFAWETGRRIVEEEQNGAMRAAYGTRLIPELSRALSAKHGPGFSESTLRKMRQFYSLNPIQPLTVELDWTDYVELMPVKDKKKRKALEQRIRKEGLKCHEIRQEVRRLRRAEGGRGPAAAAPETAQPEPAKSLPPLKRPSGLKLNTFSLSSLQVTWKDGRVLVDCGFFVIRPVAESKLKTLDIVDKMSYTYAASVLRVVDGDTLLLLIEAGLDTLVYERIRLRGIDCPEVSTPEGKRAKRFVEKKLPAGARVIIRTQKCRTDIYGRFVADVFFGENEGAGGSGSVKDAKLLTDGVFLNQLLLDQGLAVRREW